MRNTYRGKTKKKCWIWMALGSALIIVVLFGFILFTKDEIKPVNASVTPFRSIVKSTETIELNAPKLSDVVLSEPQKKNTSYPLPDFDTLTPGVDYATDEVLVSFDGDLDELTEAMADVGAGDITVISDGIALVKTPDGASVETFSEELYNEDYSVSPNYTRGLEVTGTVTLPEGVGIESFDPEMDRPNDAYAYSQWHLKEIGAYTAWDYTGGGYTSGSGVKVAIIDTGVYFAHPDLDDNIVTDAVTYTSGGQTYVDAFPLSVVEDDNGVNTAEDDNGHGTHVAGIVAAEANNSLYISGVAPGASLYCIDVFGYHNGLFCAYTSDLIQAIDAAIAADVDIINMSLGGYGSPSVAEESKINEAVAAGIVVVAAAGNNNTSAAHYPSDYENVISVIATDFNNQKSSYSNYGSAKDIAAPGGGKVSNGTIQSYIWSTYLSPSNIVGMSGTSMAAPVVSGIVALMLDEDSSLSVSQVKERLYTTAVDVGTPGYDIYTGYGVANAEYVFTGGSDFVIENGVLTAYTGRSANVYIPTIVTKIGAHAFGGNAYVQSVVISDSVESIDTMAFANCVNLSSVEFGGGVASIGAQAFYGCVSLTQVNLPVSLTALASDAFRGCSALIAINMDEANIFFRGAGGVLYSKDGSQLVLYPEGKTDSYFSIPEGVVEISESAFYAAKISTISFPSSLVSIASRAFEKSELASVTIPASVSALGAAPFVGSQNLSAISVASGNTAFRSIEGLLYSADAGTLIEYPAAMSGTEYTVMDGTVAVAESAFEGVSSLTRIILPDSVQTLGKAAFANAAALTDVQFSPNITALPERVFAGTAFTHLDLPNTITTIGAEAFEGCGNLAQITLENNLTYADGSAFIGTAPGFTIYCYRLSYAETYAKTYGYAYSQMIVGVADVSLEAMENPVVYGAEGLTLTAQATPQEGHEGDTIPEYRFYYKRSSDSEWTPVKLAFSTENTIQFKPQTEGEYDFKVVVRNQGRTVIDGEDTLFGAILYSGNTPATYVQMDTMDGRGAFLSSEAIPLTISAADETYGQPLEYQVQYSYDGKRWRSTREWNGYQTFNADENDTVQMVYTLPNARERHYFIKVNIRGAGRTGVDQSAVVEIDAYTVMPLTDVALDTSDVLSVMTSEQGILLSAQASEQSGYEGNTPEYMFYYRTQGSSRWLKITGWTTNSTVTFVPKTEDVYYFRVEARAQGRKRADVYDNDSQAFALYYGSYPVKAVSNLTTSTKEFADNPISLSFDVQANFAEDTVEYRVLYSTNKRSYKTLTGFDWQTLSHTDGRATVAVSLPESTRDVVYYIKVEARTQGRMGADAFAVTEVEKYAVSPLETLDFSIVGNNAGKQLIGEGVMLTAQAGDHALYRFYYRPQGTDTWRAISRRFTEDSETSFVPKNEGTYEFMVQAVAQGRKGFDLQVEFEYGVALYYDKFPADSISLSGVALDEGADGQDISYSVAYDQNQNEEDIELQVQYSLNGKRFSTLPGFDWQKPSPQTGFEQMMSSLPASNRDRHYYVRVNARTAGRTGVDVFTQFEIDVYAMRPLDAVALDITEPEVQMFDGGFDLSAQAEQDGEAAEAEYCFYYRLTNTNRWSVVSPGWTTSGTATFIPRKEGAYAFKVEARAVGRRGADVSSESAGSYGIYMSDLPVQSVNVINTDDDALYSISDNDMHVTMSVDANENAVSAATEWRVQVSTNGKKFVPLSGYEWQTLTQNGDGTLEKTIALPSGKRDTHYWIKISARTFGRTTEDVSEILEVDMMLALPLVSVTMDEPNMADMTENGSIILTASATTLPGAADGAEYRFLYRKAGAGKWGLVTKAFTSETDGTGRAVFMPSKEGDYEFMVQARAVGRRGIDVEDELGEAYRVFFGAEPTQTVFMDMPEKVRNNESVTVGISITPPTGETSEFRLMFSKDNRNWQVVEGYDWGVYAEPVNAALDLEKTVGDSQCYVRVEARTVGRTGTDISQTQTLQFYDLIPVESVALSVEKSGDAYVTLTATAEAISGYEEQTTVYYRYYYQRTGERGWTAFTSWGQASSTTFTPTVTADYAFRVEAVNLGRSGYDAFAENTGESGYYLEMIEMEELPVAEPTDDMTGEETEEAEATPSPVPSETPEPVPSESPSTSASPEVTPEDETMPEPTAEASQQPEITNLAFVQSEALSAVTGQQVSAERLMTIVDIEAAFDVQKMNVETEQISEMIEQGETLIVQLSEDGYAVVDAITVDEEGMIATITVHDMQGEMIIGGMTEILAAWYYQMVENEPQSTPEPEPSQAPEMPDEEEPEPTEEVPIPSVEPEPTITPEAEGQTPEPTTETSEAPEPEPESTPEPEPETKAEAPTPTEAPEA